MENKGVTEATLQWVSWFNHHRLLEPIGYIPPAEAEANYYRNSLRSQKPRAIHWQSNELPNAELLTAFVTLMAHTIQIRGVYFDEPGCTAAVQSAANLLDCSLSST